MTSEQKTKYFAEVSAGNNHDWTLARFATKGELDEWIEQAKLEKLDADRFVLPDGRTVLIFTGRTLPPKVGV